MNPRHISVCICTYKRPQLLARLLDCLDRQQTAGAFTISLAVADNDAARSAEAVVRSFARRSPIAAAYGCEARQNIALARNLALANATGEFVAFIDDDEFPAEDWLARHLQVCLEPGISGVLGPVRPHFESAPPSWILKGRFCERPEYPTGTVMDWTRSRTGNVLFRRDILSGPEPPFLPDFGTGGEDQDFFRRLTARGCRFVWCNEAVVYETVPPARWTRRYMLRRALLRGRNGLKHSTARAKLVGTSLLAVPLYALMLPATLLFGQHVFMHYGIRLCDHVGRLLALCGLNPVSERSM